MDDFEQPPLLVSHCVGPGEGMSLADRLAESGELRLMLAIFLDAVSILRRWENPESTVSRRIMRETVRWIMSSDTLWLYSFESVCMHLDADPARVRRTLRLRFRI